MTLPLKIQIIDEMKFCQKILGGLENFGGSKKISLLNIDEL